MNASLVAGLDLGKLPDLESVLAEKALRAKKALSEYIKQAWPVVEPHTEYLHNWHIDAISEYLEAVSAGEIRRLLINMPPRYMKSTCVTIMWPTWEWITKPWTQWMFASYSEGLATDHSLARRRIIESDWYRARWGDVFNLASDQNLKTSYENNHRGKMVAIGMGGTSTGLGGNRLVVDDPQNPKKAESDLERLAARRDFTQSLSTRLNNKKLDPIVVVMQRLHSEDVSAICLEFGYTHLNLPAEAEGHTVISLPRSGRQIVREPGDLLWPEREGPKEIAEQKVTLGSYGYAGQYQQRPSPMGGGILKRHWWGFWHYKSEPLPPVRTLMPDGTLYEHKQVPLPELDQFDEILQSWDMAFKDTKKSDYVAGQVWARQMAWKFLLDQVLDRMNMPATVQAVKDLSAKWPHALTKLIEDKANGPAVISTLQGEVSGLIPVEPMGSKSARVHAVSPMIEAGNVFLPHPQIAPWVPDFLEYCAQFPNGKVDDPIDTMSQALARWSTHEGGGFH